MVGISLVHALEDDWRETLDSVARERGWPSSRDVGKLAESVAHLSAAYNDAERARASVAEMGAARLGFSFARDVPKGAAAVRELVLSRTLPSEGMLRVLDLGAGLGATTWGLVRALSAAGGSLTVEASWVDPDAAALDVALDIVRRRRQERGPELRVETRRASLDAVGRLGPFDVVLLGNVLSELAVGAEPEVRAREHVELVNDLFHRHVGEQGALVLVEPALRERTRHLHRVRDALTRQGFSVFAPCLHDAPCPALELSGDWCHESLPVDLPAWLVPVARAAGLRFERLTFSYLVLKRGRPRLRDAIASRPGAARLRVVSDAIVTKGKSELFLCGEYDGEAGSVVAARKRATRLLRHSRDTARTSGSDPWSDLVRGDLAVVDPAPSIASPKIGPESRIDIVHDLEPRNALTNSGRVG
jgi:ribosomal protein RSM22 (predicted rRNA methylase)